MSSLRFPNPMMMTPDGGVEAFFKRIGSYREVARLLKTVNKGVNHTTLSGYAVKNEMPLEMYELLKSITNKKEVTHTLKTIYTIELLDRDNNIIGEIELHRGIRAVVREKAAL